MRTAWVLLLTILKAIFRHERERIDEDGAR